MTALGIVAVVVFALFTIYLLTGILFAVGRVADEVGRLIALEQQRQNEWRALTVTPEKPRATAGRPVKITTGTPAGQPPPEPKPPYDIGPEGRRKR